MEHGVHYVYNPVFPLTECITLDALALLPSWAGDDRCCQKLFIFAKKKEKNILFSDLEKNPNCIVIVLLAF